MLKQNLSLIIACIPAYNEEKTIGKVILQAQKFVDKVIVVDDGSEDYTAQIARGLGAIVILHEKNLGYGAAINSLFKEALRLGADIAVVLDGDNQHDPSEIPRIIKPLVKEEADMVLGSRFLNEGDSSEVSGYRRLGLKFITDLSAKTSYNGITDAQCGFRAYSRKALEDILVTEQGMGASTEILFKAKDAGLRVVEVPVKVHYNSDPLANDHSSNSFAHGLDVFMTTIKQISIRHPLKFYGIPGFLSVLVGLTFGVWTLQIFSVSRSIDTNITLIALGATMVGLMLMMTGLLLWILVSVVKEKL